jgi:ribonuclease E
LSFVIEKGEQVHSLEQAKALALQPASAVPIQEEDEDDYEDEEEPASEDAETSASEAEAQPAGEPGPGRRRRRRRRGRHGGEDRAAFQQEREESQQERGEDFAPTTGDHDIGRAEEPHEAASVGGLEQPEESHGEGERRRRRRGRRGGRRNRRGREGENFARNVAVEPELGRADFEQDLGAEAASPSAPFGEPEPRAIPISEAHSDLPAAADAEPQAAEPDVSEPTAPEAPRRRSTVREPAPQALHEEANSPPPSFTPPAPSIEPVVSSSEESESGDRPRRSGWWSKRVLGKS